MYSSMAYLKSFDFNTLKKSHGKGTDRQTDRQTDRHTHRRTSRLLDGIGPVGRFGEKTGSIMVSDGFCDENIVNFIIYFSIIFFCMEWHYLVFSIAHLGIARTKQKIDMEKLRISWQKKNKKLFNLCKVCKKDFFFKLISIYRDPPLKHNRISSWKARRFKTMTAFRIIFEHIFLHLLQNKCQSIRTPPLPSNRGTPTLL